jgi:hypothetical protein
VSRRDPLAAARGIMTGLAICCVAWPGIIILVMWALEAVQ